MKVLHITFLDGSTPVTVITDDDKIIRKHVDYNRIYRGRLIKSLRVVEGVKEMSVLDSCPMINSDRIDAMFFETFAGNKYYRDEHGNVYTRVGAEIAYCSNLKRGRLTENKAEPSYPVDNVNLIG